MKYENLTFSKLNSMKRGTSKFYKANTKFFKVEKNIQGLKAIGARRKSGYEEAKKLMTPSEVWSMASNDAKYINEVKKRDFALLNGDYLGHRANTYISNYLASLKSMTINPKIIEFLEKNPNIILEGLLPEIDNYYVYMKGKGKTKSGNNYVVNLDEATNYENVIKAVIKEFYGEEL